MRLVSDRYCYANPFLEPVSLDWLVAPNGDGPAEPLGHSLRDEDADPVGDVERREARVAIHGFVAGLGEQDRLLIIRMFWDDVSQADVARTLQVSGAAISKRLRRVIDKGRLALGSVCSASSLQ